MNSLTFADVSEGVRATIAAYTQALDDGRTDDVIATMDADATCEFPGVDPLVGHAALRAAYDSWRPRRPQRHLVLNTLITSWDDSAASAISDVVFLASKGGAWNVQLVGRYHDSLRNDDGVWRFTHRAATFETLA